MCVCVCVFFPAILVTAPSDQGETCASLCSVFRGLHFPAYFSVSLNQPGSHRRRANTGAFSFLLFLMPHLLLRCLPPFFYREKGPAVPSLGYNDVEFCQLTKLFSSLPLSTTSYDSVCVCWCVCVLCVWVFLFSGTFGPPARAWLRASGQRSIQQDPSDCC